MGSSFSGVDINRHPAYFVKKEVENLSKNLIYALIDPEGVTKITVSGSKGESKYIIDGNEKSEIPTSPQIDDGTYPEYTHHH